MANRIGGWARGGGGVCFAVGALLTIFGPTACSRDDRRTSEQPGSAQQALSSIAVRTFGFESLADWTTAGSTSIALSSDHSEGTSSLALTGGGWMEVTSRPLSKELAAPSVIGYDVRIADHPLNAYWYGTTELYLNAPSVGIWNQFVGHAELTPLPPGHFQRVEFTVPTALGTKLAGNYSDLTLRIAVNVSSGEPASYLLDHFTFGPASQCSPQPDGNPCTDDICDNGAPAWPPRPAGSSCDTNATVCDGVGTCSAAAVCEMGPAPSIDDGNPCTSDACDPVNGVVHLPVASGVSCETDEDVCNGISRCDGAGACAAGSPPALDDDNPCTTDSCDAVLGVQHATKPVNTSCDADANLCNGDALCDAAGVCVAQPAPSIDDANPCTEDSCDPASGVHHTPGANGTSCDDGDACTSGDSCQAGVCTAGAPTVCVALDQCHNPGSCNPSTGLCTTPAKADGAACSDGDACTQTDACSNGVCLGTNPVLCVAQDACHTAGACDAGTGACSNPTAPNGVACDDATVCNGHESCENGSCVAAAPPPIDDGNPCTTDACDPITGAIHVAVADGTSCESDGNACNGVSTCSGGVCAAGSPPETDDGNPCTVDSCDPATGVEHLAVADGVACSDGYACTVDDQCQAGACVAGAPKVCAAVDQCHSAGACDPTSGACSSPVKADGSSCDDGDACTLSDACQNGACQGSSPVVCAALDACHTAGTCDSLTGSCSNPTAPNGVACDDATVCNGHESCENGSCVAAAPPPIDDGNPCTTDACDPVTGATHLAVADGTSCALDGNPCSGLSICASGVCQPAAGPALDDGNDCTVDACDPATGQISHAFTPAGTGCSAIDACHDDGTCDGAGRCAPGEPLAFDDGDPCTIETCDPVAGLTRRSCSTVDETVATVVADVNQWIYSGTDPLQSGVAPGTITRTRGAVIRGQVWGEAGLPLGGVSVSVRFHPEFGQTVTQTNGEYLMVVNGGGSLALQFHKPAFLDAERAVDVPWASQAQVDDLVMLQSDPAVSEIDLQDTSQPFQVVQGSLSTDDDGSRRATALVPAGTVATLTNADGTTEPLDFLSVRITEFTVGQLGKERMPAPLPPQSAYTYAFEINADEAVAVGAKEVSFSSPLIYYVDNFLNFPSGTAVPLGSYDRDKGAWVASPNGLVIKIVSVTGGLADLSIDTDAPAETPAELSAVGITTEERATLATLYPVGQSLWRVLLPHFTSPWDCNWGASPPPDAKQPPPSPPDPDVPDPCNDAAASSIECQNQILREDVAVAGTPFGLHYSSQRVPGWTVGRTKDITVTGPTIPGSLRQAQVNIEVGGKTYSQIFPAAPNQKTSFTWDGLDAQQRGSMGKTQAKISVGFLYDLQYTFTSAFGYNGNGVAITGDKARGDITLSRETAASLGLWDQRRMGLGGWSLSVHHAYDPESQTVYRGDGTRQAGTFVGLAAYANVVSPPGTYGDGPNRVAIAADGSIYAVGGFGYPASLHTVTKVAPNGFATRVAGQVTVQQGYGGDNGPATEALMAYPEDVELGPDGSIYIADTRNHRVRKVTPDGIIRTIAGTGTAGFSGDGGPATLAQLNWPAGLALGADGVLYIADRDNYRVRRIGTDGTITTVAGHACPCGFPAEDVAATEVGDWMYPSDVAVEADGGLLVSDPLASVIRRVNTKGRVSTAAGIVCINGCSNGEYIDGVPATQTPIGYAQGIVTLPDHSYYFADSFRGYIHYVDPEGIHHLIAGGGTNTREAPGVAARTLELGPYGVAVGPSGIVIPDRYYGRLITLRPAAFPPLGTTDALVASTDGSEVYQFDAQGRHQTTRDAITGAIRYQFGYEGHGYLASVTDAYNNVTTIERDASGIATAIVGPYGQRTELGYDANGYLDSVQNPLGQSVGMTYTPSGLLTAFQNARGQSSAVQYDERGRLLSDQDPAGGAKTLTRTELSDGWRIDLTTTDAGTKTLEVHKLADGREQRHVTFADGTSRQETRALDGTFTTTLADGTIDTVVRSADPRYGIETPVQSHSVRLPSGLTYTETTARTVTLTNALDPFSVSALTDQRTVNGRLWRESYDATTKTWTIQSPTGRRSFRRINTKGDLVEDRTDTLLGRILGYDTQGRISTLTQGSRQSLLSYFTSGPAQGYLETSRNPLLQTTTFSRDALGQALSTLDPASNLSQFTWDPDGNLASVAPPGRPAHGMDYTPVNLVSQYAPPVLASLPDARTVYEYNLARQLARSTRPDGLVTDYTYDPAGRLSDITTPSGVYHRDYYGLIPCAGCAAGRVSHLTSPDSVALDYLYDGQLLTKATWSGAVNGAVAFAYNSDFRVKTETVTSAAGTDAYQFGFDNDTLLTCASPTNCTTPGTDALTLTYHPNHGLPTGSTIRTVTEALTYSTVGELATQLGKVGATTVLSETYDSTSAPRDALGRIQRKVELLNGTTNTWDYTYDLAGRLQTVQLNGAPYETYSYDPNGNRLSVVKPTATTTATYDDQDRLLTYGPWTYTYTPNGELLTKSNSTTGANWAYAYDVFGNLKRVDLPNGDVIEYLVDGQNRRVAKKRNGALVKQWLYEDQLHPVAELDGSGNLVSRFVWASKKNTPDLVITAGITYRVLTDQLGSPRALVDTTSGTIAGVMRHDAWGVVLEDSVSTLMPFGFAGGLYDAETGLVRFGARDYDASIGRWVSKDPIRFDGGQANLYVYVGNDPVNATDQTGLAAGSASPSGAAPQMGCKEDPDCEGSLKACGNDCQNLPSGQASDCSTCCVDRFFKCKNSGINITPEESCRQQSRKRK